MSVSNFIKYNNAVPIVISVFLLISGTVAAANPDVREGVATSLYQQEQTVISIDNTYIAGMDLEKYSPEVKIIKVTEDEDNYYITYHLSTIDLVEYVWQNVEQERLMTVAKGQLGKKDLGVYVTRQLRELIDLELTRLTATQEFEKQNISKMKISTKYKGLVGKMLDDTTETLPGYKPVIPEPKQAPTEPAKIPPTPPSVPPPSTVGEEEQEMPDTTDTTPPVIQILGNNPHHVVLGGTYTDLGAAVTDDQNGELSYLIYVDDTLVSAVTIDTATSGQYAVTYVASDETGNRSSSTRLVIVSEVEDDGNGGSGGMQEVSKDQATTSDETIESPTPPSTTPADDPLPVTTTTSDGQEDHATTSGETAEPPPPPPTPQDDEPAAQEPPPPPPETETDTTADTGAETATSS